MSDKKSASFPLKIDSIDTFAGEWRVRCARNLSSQVSCFEPSLTVECKLGMPFEAVLEMTWCRMFESCQLSDDFEDEDAHSRVDALSPFVAFRVQSTCCFRQALEVAMVKVH